LEPNFIIYKSNKLENFLGTVVPKIRALAEKAPLKKKSIVVQSDGMARWLTLKVTSELGSFANFEFVSPDVFLRNFAEKYFQISSDDVYNKKNAEWALYSLLRNEKSGLTGKYIGGNEARAFRFSRTLADLFEQYFVYRPDMMRRWQEENPEMPSDHDELWQFEIFRRLAEMKNIGTSGFAQLFNEKCRNAPLNNADYPDELILFGISIMNSYQLDMFRNLSRLFPVHLFSMSPSQAYFSVSKEKGGFEKSEENHGLSAETLPDTFFGRFCAAGLDFFNFVLDNDLAETDLFENPEGKTLLASLQRDILNDAETPEPAENDDTVKIISCRDKMREIEVLKDTLLELFNKDETLKPEDIAVMAPKINDYVPYITAVFGGTDPSDKTFVPWVISDRNFSGESRIAATFLEILRLVGSDFEKSKVLSVFRTPCVCAKFGVTEKALDDVEKILDESGVRWGLDADSRGGNSAEPRQNTWDFGLSRIMMSLVMPFSEDGEGFEDILPTESFFKEDSDSISGFISFAKELFRYSKLLSSGGKSPSEFKNLLEGMLDFFFVCDYSGISAKEEIRHIKNVIDNFAETVSGQNIEQLSFDALLQYLEDELGRERQGRGFLSAKVNFCSLKPLRALPFKVIYLVGMGDGEFPRSENRYAFDLTQKKEPGAPLPRSVRENDKYLFAEAVVSAREKLFISYEAGDFAEDSKKHRRAAMPVQILEKYIVTKTGVKAEELETKYPVQPFSEEYFKEGGAFRTFSVKDFRIAQAMSVFHVEQNASSPLPKRLPEQSVENVDLENLVSFFKDPLKFYLTKTLKIVLPGDNENKGDEELFDYSDDRLLEYNVRKTYVDMARNIEDTGKLDDAFFRRMKGEGKMPFGAFGKAELKEEIASRALCAGVRKIAEEEFEFEDFSLDFPGFPLKLQGRIRNIDRKNGSVIFVSPAKFKVKYKIGLLIRHFAANAYGLNVNTEYFFNDSSGVLKKLPKEEAEADLWCFLNLWADKSRMPLFDPDLIDAVRKLKIPHDADPGRINDDVKNKAVSFFEEKWSRRNDEFSFLSKELLLAAGQFVQHKERFLSDFPAEEVLEISRLLEKFYPSGQGGRRK